VAASSRRVPPRRARRTIASFSSFADAERAVGYLADQHLPAGALAIVGTGLHRSGDGPRPATSGRAALVGAVQGAASGVLFASLFGLFFTATGVGVAGLLVYGVVSGALAGALFGALAHVARGAGAGGPPAAPVADRYEVLADDAVADEAERLLRALPEAPAT
jgi:hypothetical protein